MICHNLEPVNTDCISPYLVCKKKNVNIIIIKHSKYLLLYYYSYIIV